MGKTKNNYKTYNACGIISGNVHIPIKARTKEELERKLNKLFKKYSSDEIADKYGYLDIELTVAYSEDGKEIRI